MSVDTFSCLLSRSLSLARSSNSTLDLFFISSVSSSISHSSHLLCFYTVDSNPKSSKSLKNLLSVGENQFETLNHQILESDAYMLQLKMFLYEVKQPQLLSGVRTFLKVCLLLHFLLLTWKLMRPTLRTILLTYKHKTHSVDSGGSRNLDIDFYIKNDMIYVVESKSTKRYGYFFLRQITKVCDLKLKL